mmetsp:Transcript_31156/g.81752  ORF Transcript_31156/g.81752 Transcript_31156/m.81752 type:complete len:210 (+) Transcript_31156:663-1292(+)
MPTAAEGSITIFILSITSAIVSLITRSSTVKILSTFSFIIGQVTSPKLVSRPSAIELGLVLCRILSPASSDRLASSAAAGSAPNTRVWGRSARIAEATPLIIPPPPTGTTTASISAPPDIASTCSIISSPIVAWPHITKGWLYGGIITPPVSFRTLAHVSSLDFKFGCAVTTFAPYPSTALLFTAGASEGMMTVACTPCSFAANDNACA